MAEILLKSRQHFRLIKGSMRWASGTMMAALAVGLVALTGNNASAALSDDVTSNQWIGQPPLVVKTPRPDAITSGSGIASDTVARPVSPSVGMPAGGWIGQPSLVIRPNQAMANRAAPATEWLGQPPLAFKGAKSPAPKVISQSNTPNEPAAAPAVVPPSTANQNWTPAYVPQAAESQPMLEDAPAPQQAAASENNIPPSAPPAVAAAAQAAAQQEAPATDKPAKPDSKGVVAFYPKQPINAPVQPPEMSKTAAALPDQPPQAVIIPDTKVSAQDLQDGTFIRNLSGTDGVLALDVGGNDAPDMDHSIRVDEAVALALKNNFEVQASDAKLDGSHWEKLGSYSQYAPSIEMNYASGMETSKPGAINDANGSRVLDNTHHRRDSSLFVRQPLIDLSIIGDILRTHANENIAETDLRDVKEGIAFDTVNVFMKLTQARIAIKLADQYKAYLDDLSQRMSARVEGGGATSADLDRIKGRSTLAESARIEALGDYQSNLSEFRRLTHAVPAHLKVPDILVPAIPSDPQEAMKSAVTSNPSYLSSLRKIDAANANRNKSIANIAPKLSLEYNKTHVYDADGAAQGSPVDGVYPTQDEERVMLVAHWALSGGTSFAEAMEGVTQEREMRLRAQDVRARLEQAVHTSYNAIRAASNRITVLQLAIEADTRVVKDFEDQYKGGTRSLFDLLDAYEHLYSAQLDLMRVTIAKAQASYQIRRQMGQLVPAIMSAEKH